MLPILANLLGAIAVHVVPSFSVLFGRGELLILAAGLTATAIGDLALARLAEGSKNLRTILSGWAIANLFGASVYFALVSRGHEGGIVMVSFVSYASAVLCGGWCVLLSERGERDNEHR